MNIWITIKPKKKQLIILKKKIGECDSIIFGQGLFQHGLALH
jgi:hypothetical protein